MGDLKVLRNRVAATALRAELGSQFFTMGYLRLPDIVSATPRIVISNESFPSAYRHTEDYCRARF
jgi:hypothetical protein